VFEHCDVVPWTIVPADQNWHKEHLIAKKLVDSFKALDMKFPPLKEK
jgi:polyphosphate kinase 2 (PPK2 family)